MVSFKKTSVTLLVTFILIVFSATGSADLIILKDGTRVDAQSVWEDDGLVRFTLPDYDGIIITYSKEIIERIEKGQQGNPSQPKAVMGTERPATEMGAEAPTVTKDGGALPSADRNAEDGFSEGVAKAQDDTSAAPFRDPEIDMALVESVTGIEFYSARRDLKYQTRPDARFRTFKDAVDDLAAKFDKDPYWVGQNLGNTNDLGQIYINLSRSAEEDETVDETEAETAGILFYDPRRAFKYWVTTDSKHHTLEEAVNTLAKQYERTPDWIIDHLGETNDLAEIHRNLVKGKSAETGQ